MPLIDKIVDLAPEMTTWRRDIHAHPELGFQENRTADFVAEKLTQWGLQVFRGIGKTGLVGVLKVGNETQSIGLRADMDALPITERNTFEHRSTHDGTMHACGHDGHTTMLLAAAKYLSTSQNFRGQVNFIFQPAEEGIGGAKAMIEDGLFEQFPCDTLYAMHNAPKMPVGAFAAVPGIRTAAGAFFDIDIIGKGAHGAFPDQGVDPVLIAGELIVALQSIVSRNMRPTQTAVLSITQVHGGDAYNVIPSTTRLSGTVRTLDMRLMKKIESRMDVMVFVRHMVQTVRWISESFFTQCTTTMPHRKLPQISAMNWSGAKMCIAIVQREPAQKISLLCPKLCLAVISILAMVRIVTRSTITTMISMMTHSSMAPASSQRL